LSLYSHVSVTVQCIQTSRKYQTKTPYDKLYLTLHLRGRILLAIFVAKIV